MISIRDKKDFLAGLIFVGSGVLGWVLGLDLTSGTITRMGPGYLPKFLSSGLILLGLFISLKAIRFGESSLERWTFRPMFFIFGGILAFAFLISRFGLALSVLVVTVLSAFGTPEVRWKESLIMGVFMAGLSALLFIYFLGLPIQVWPL
jgi:putative tricarboxylic transport membrane protein